MANHNASICFDKPPDTFRDNFSDPGSVLSVITGDSFLDREYLEYLVGNCSTVCPAALGNGNPDLAGIGVRSNQSLLHSHSRMILDCMST